MKNATLSSAVAIVLGCLTAPAAAQAGPSDPAAKEALDVVVRLFDGMRAKDTAMVRSTFHETARLMSAARGPGGTPVVEVGDLDQFLTSIANANVYLDERLYEIEVRVDDGLATVWTEYDFWAGDRFSHCGVDAFQLARTAEGWKIIQITDTRRREGCTRAPGG